MTSTDIWRGSFVFYACWAEKSLDLSVDWYLLFFPAGPDRIWRLWLATKGMDPDSLRIPGVPGGTDCGLEWETGSGEQVHLPGVARSCMFTAFSYNNI